ncbi:MAG TPA: PilZ domain-containing protein [Terriglobales bacterium]|nr:PilZ domain-containing protein [Terriglobales bacterium]
MAAQSLVLCRDPDVLRTLCPLLFEMDMGVEICLGTNGASRMLRKRRFDAVIVECGSDGTGLDVLQEIRQDTPNQNTITVGVVDDPEAMKAALATGANFVLAKPISVEDAGRILRFTRGMVSRMVRRFLRVAVHHLSHVDVAGMKDPAFILDLSEGGMAMQSLAPMETGQAIDVGFFLPGTQTHITTGAHVVWTDSTGRIGLEFDGIPESSRAQLKSWVVQRLKNSPEDVPGSGATAANSIRVLSQWMRPLARLIDAMYVLVAASLFCTVVYLLLWQNATNWPMSYAFGVAFLIVSALYASLFHTLDVRFPGTRTMQSLLSMASSRQAG